MPSIGEITQATTAILRSKYSLPVYAEEFKDGYKKPSFFIDVLPIKSTVETKAISESSVLVAIYYYSDTRDSVANKDFMDSLKRALGITLKCGRRSLLVQDKEINVENEEKDIYSLSFTMTYKEWNELEKEQYELMKELHQNNKGVI